MAMPVLVAYCARPLLLPCRARELFGDEEDEEDLGDGVARTRGGVRLGLPLLGLSDMVNDLVLMLTNLKESPQFTESTPHDIIK